MKIRDLMQLLELYEERGTEEVFIIDPRGEALNITGVNNFYPGSQDKTILIYDEYETI